MAPPRALKIGGSRLRETVAVEWRCWHSWRVPRRTRLRRTGTLSSGNGALMAFPVTAGWPFPPAESTTSAVAGHKLGMINSDHRNRGSWYSE